LASLWRLTSNFKAASRRRPATTSNHCSSGEVMTVRFCSKPTRAMDAASSGMAVPPLWRTLRLEGRSRDKGIRCSSVGSHFRYGDGFTGHGRRADGCRSSHGAQGQGFGLGNGVHVKSPVPQGDLVQTMEDIVKRLGSQSLLCMGALLGCWAPQGPRSPSRPWAAAGAAKPFAAMGSSWGRRGCAVKGGSEGAGAARRRSRGHGRRSGP